MTRSDSRPPSTPQVSRTPGGDRLAEWERLGRHRWGLGVASDLYDVECRVAVLEKAILDAAQAARAAPFESSVPLGKGLGTGDTQEPSAASAGSVSVTLHVDDSACGLPESRPLRRPGLRLTDAEREAIEAGAIAIDRLDEEMDGFSSSGSRTLRALLDRLK